MLTLKSNLRKELAYAIVESWAQRDGGEKILDTYFKNSLCCKLTAGLLTQENFEALEGCVDKTFLSLLNYLYDPISEAIDDWLDVYRISHYEDYSEREKKTMNRRLSYGT